MLPLIFTSGALVHMKMRKILLGQMEKIEASVMNLEIQKMAMEEASVNLEILHTVKNTNATMKNLQKEA